MFDWLQNSNTLQFLLNQFCDILKHPLYRQRPSHMIVCRNILEWQLSGAFPKPRQAEFSELCCLALILWRI